MDTRESVRIIVQCDWSEAFRENEGKCWVAFRKTGRSSIYGELKCHGLSSNGEPYVLSDDGFTVENISRKSMTVSYRDGESSGRRKFQSPLTTFTTVHNARKTVSCLDVTPGGLAVSCDTEGKLRLWTSSNGEVRRELSGHLGDVYTCQFFPSGVVVLSGGADMQLKIWSAETGQCAATLRGHKAGITDTSIVERGKNILSSSRDGTVKLWDCGSQTCLTTVEPIGGIINGCTLGVPDSVNLGVPDNASDEKESMTEGKMLLLACENGTLQAFGLHSRKKIFSVSCSDAVNCCTFVSPTVAACGTQDGQLYVYDIRNTSFPLLHTTEGRSTILSMMPYKQGLFTTTGDGSCFYMNEELQTDYELTGPDCDPVYKAVFNGSHLYTACRDGCIRKYQV